MGVASRQRPRSDERQLRSVGFHSEGNLPGPGSPRNLPLHGADQSAAGRHGLRMLPQVEAGRSSDRQARFATDNEYGAGVGNSGGTRGSSPASRGSAEQCFLGILAAPNQAPGWHSATAVVTLLKILEPADSRILSA
jgi:hypothetical protein